jgi:hypothetical protein
VPPYGQPTNTGPRKQRRSFRQSFHQPLLIPSGAAWLDDQPDVSCKESTRQYAVDEPLLSCNSVPTWERPVVPEADDRVVLAFLACDRRRLG